LTNSPENKVRISGGKIVTRYTLLQNRAAATREAGAEQPEATGKTGTGGRAFGDADWFSLQHYQLLRQAA